jgi:antitoxin CptB
VETIEKQNEELRRLTWHSRRGMLELDVLLLPFTENRYSDLSDDEKTKYKRLIDCEDQDLFNWFMSKSTCDDEGIQQMVEVVLDYARNR